jgi:hypothetical protein
VTVFFSVAMAICGYDSALGTDTLVPQTHLSFQERCACVSAG